MKFGAKLACVVLCALFVGEAVDVEKLCQNPLTKALGMSF